MPKNKVFLRSEHNYDMDEATLESALHCTDESLAQQSSAEETDINTIVRRFGLTGQLPTGVVVPSYADFEEAYDFRTAMDTVVQGREAFMQMPADVRKRFANDPALFLEFVHDEKNYDEAVKLGIALPEPKVEKPEPLEVIVVPTAVPGSVVDRPEVK